MLQSLVLDIASLLYMRFPKKTDLSMAFRNIRSDKSLKKVEWKYLYLSLLKLRFSNPRQKTLTFIERGLVLQHIWAGNCLNLYCLLQVSGEMDMVLRCMEEERISKHF